MSPETSAVFPWGCGRYALGVILRATRAEKRWLILGHESGGRHRYSLLVVELSWKITRGVFVSEADRSSEQDGHGFIRCGG